MQCVRVCLSWEQHCVQSLVSDGTHTKIQIKQPPIKNALIPLICHPFMNHCLAYVFIRHLEALTPPMMPRSLYKSVSGAWIIRAEAGVCGKSSELWDFLIDSGGLCEHVCLVLI